MEKDEILRRLEKQRGRPGEIARALIKWDESDWMEQQAAFAALAAVLLKNSPRTCAAMFDDGPRQLFAAVHGQSAADWAGKAAARLHLYVHSPSVYRRSFRTKEVKPYLDRFVAILATLFFAWQDFDLTEDLTAGERKTAAATLGAFVYADLLAVRIDEGDARVVGAVKEILLGDGNTRLLSDAIINGIIKSADRELHKILADLLLAAKLQEGLRQSILENADNGRVEAFIYLIKIVLDNDLLRYSAAIRALDVWMGLGESFEDKRVAAKLLSLGYDYLTGAKPVKAGIESADLTEIYAALWAVSVEEMNTLLALIDQLMQGEKYQKLAGLYFLQQTENRPLQSFAAARLLGETDLDILSLVISNYLSAYIGWHNSTDDFIAACRGHEVLSEDGAREQQFASLLNLLPLAPAGGHTAQGKPFPWYDLSLTRDSIFVRLLIVAGYDRDPGKIARLIEVMPLAGPDNRVRFIRFFLDDPGGGKGRDFVFAALNDKSMSVRSRALETVVEFAKKSPLTEEEEKSVLKLLSLKTGDVRQNALQILHSLPGERPLTAAKTLLADKNENRRLAALDMLTRFVQQTTLSKTAAAELCALMPAVSDRERVLIDTLTAGGSEYSKANGFGLYDPDYVPDFPVPPPDKKHTLNYVFNFSIKRLTKIFDALCGLIRENRGYTFKVHSYDGDAEVALGALEWLRPRAEVYEDDDLSVLEKFVLQDVWRGWLRDNAVSFGEILLFRFIREVKNYNDRYELSYEPWANKYIEKLFRAREIEKFIVYWSKREYGKLAMQIIGALHSEYAEDERFAATAGVLTDLLTRVAEKDWKRPVNETEDRPYYRSRSAENDTLADTEEVRFLLGELKMAAETDEHFRAYTGFCFILGRLSGMFYLGLQAAEVARAVDLGLVRPDALYRTMFLSGGDCMRNYAGKIRWDKAKKDVEKYPFLKKAADEAAARIVEIELRRGDSPTEVSSLAMNISWHAGAETFARILVALGTETFVRGYYYGGSGQTKKAVLSSLLKSSRPAAQDNAETLRAALAGKISDKRLIEAAMYAPAWIDIAGDYLGWPGLKSAVWYFHAHINEDFSAEKETEVARYSPITPQEFNDGAFDVDWFREAYGTLGAERFALVYDCAKYLTEGSNHRRAQLFADAALGKLEAAALWEEVHAKRSRDKLLSYSLLPLPEGREQEEALERYENIQLFLQESKSFGAQRRASEGKACAIALENLGRNAGFSDALRFTWRMEILKIESVRKYFTDRTIGDYSVRVSIDKTGSAALVCEKGGKALSAVPAALKKDPYILECKEIAVSLKAQYKRARENMERIMVNGDVFSFGEIGALMEHPVVAPLLDKLVLVSLREGGAPAAAGIFAELAGTLRDTDQVRLAHPHDLYTLGTWLDWQRYAFEQKLVQPFKQIFRELYLLNEDEREAKTVSRRYAGHQVQPKKTVALLKSRLWTVDYEEGLQRVYYRENLYVKLYAAADWFSPADIEAPTLETVEFFDRKTHAAVPLEKIPPLIFSEVMRDVDLVVSVAHVGGVDPEASLSTVEMRAAIVRELLRLLHIVNVTVENRHAKITGKLGEYTVHLGSAQAHMMGRGAVNILAVPGQHRGRLFLPFADDDPRTAEVMSKIILLAEDGKIKDPAILAQIG
ncbi:MAG: DUF5724 domain-containing protein [Gracilibacteraceae bacterium]|jgi:hypothetical protein|nr:DUF5724 domain-containing protein [Gracilibacteraceae bacterium]